MAEVIHLPLEHRDSLQTHAESEAAVLPGVYAGGLQHVWIYHSASHNLEPAGALADVAPLAVADVATHVNFCRRFREREV